MRRVEIIFEKRENGREKEPSRSLALVDDQFSIFAPLFFVRMHVPHYAGRRLLQAENDAAIWFGTLIATI